MILEMVRIRAWQRLGEKDLCPALTIAGFALDGKKWDGLYLGRRKGRDLIYAGKVDHGFDTAKDLHVVAI